MADEKTGEGIQNEPLVGAFKSRGDVVTTSDNVPDLTGTYKITTSGGVTSPGIQNEPLAGAYKITTSGGVTSPGSEPGTANRPASGPARGK